VTPLTLQRKRQRSALKAARVRASKKAAAEYRALLHRRHLEKLNAQKRHDAKVASKA
jgi:hypothetical protein